MSKLNLFVPLTKVDVAKREVWGRAVQEVVDKVDEIFDYQKSKPHFEAWSKSFSEATDGKSLGNIRAMHGKVAAGKAIAVNFNDADKAIDIGAKIVDDNEWNKVLEGVYTGFSIGGSYVGDRVTEKVGDREVKRYVAAPSEISIVDNPCIPTAKFFDIVKADGSIEKVAFKPQNPVLEVTGTDDEVAEFAKVLNESKLTLADAISAVKNEGAARAMLDTTDELKKREFSTDEREKAAKEGEALPDGSFPIKTVADLENAVRAYGRAKDKEAAKRHIIARAKALGATDKLPEGWTDKATPSGDVEKLIADAARAGELRKRLDDPNLSLVDLMKLAEAELSEDERKALKTSDDVRKALLGKKMSAADQDRLQAAHDHLASMGAKCNDSDADGKAAPSALTKALETIATLQKDVDTLKKQPVPMVTLRAVKREDDAPASVEKATPDDLSTITLEPADYIKNADGSIDYFASRVNKASKLALKAATA